MAPNKGIKNIGQDRFPDDKQASPDWAVGLRQLYDSVVEEPLPDSFAELLDRLDSSNG